MGQYTHLSEAEFIKMIQELTPPANAAEKERVQNIIMEIHSRIKKNRPLPTKSEVGYKYTTWAWVIIELWRNTRD